MLDGLVLLAGFDGNGSASRDGLLGSLDREHALLRQVRLHSRHVHILRQQELARERSEISFLN